MPQQVLLSGAMRGLAVGVLAVGVILIYRSCRVINFALGELGALAAALFVRLTVNWHWNFYAALGLMIVGGALMGALLELALLRRLAKAPRVVVMVATIGAAQLLLFPIVLLAHMNGGQGTQWLREWLRYGNWTPEQESSNARKAAQDDSTAVYVGTSDPEVASPNPPAAMERSSWASRIRCLSMRPPATSISPAIRKRSIAASIRSTTRRGSWGIPSGSTLTTRSTAATF